MKRIAIFVLALSGPCLAGQPAGDAAPPAMIRDSMADGIYGAEQMDRARAILAAEHGGAQVSKVMASILEYTSASAGAGYRWDAEGWYGGDVHRFVFKTEGEGLRRGELESAEVQALYSNAVGRYTDLQAGVRYDLQPDGRGYATVALESMLPYWIRTEAALFLSDRGDVFSRLKASHDLRLTQRWILQPRVELTLAGRDVPDAGIGSGLSSAELGLRLRYEIRREVAPYLGVNFERGMGHTADFRRSAGHPVEEARFVLGLRAWF